MKRKNDIQIKIILHGNNGRIDYKYIMQVFNSLESALYKSDSDDILRICHQLDVSDILRDACLERIRKYKNHRFIVNGAKNQIITLDVLVIATSLFILKNTIGESLKEAYKDSELHDRLKCIFKEKLDLKVKAIKSLIVKELAKKDFDVNSTNINFDNIDPSTIIIDVGRRSTVEPEEEVKTIGEELDDDNNNKNI